MLYIHVPKTGGSCISQSAIPGFEGQFHNSHEGTWSDRGPPIWVKGKKYLITVRNPIARFVSAFAHMMEHSESFREFTQHWGIASVNDLTNRLGDPDFDREYGKIGGHLIFNFHVYLQPFLNVCDPKSITILLTDQLESECLKKLTCKINTAPRYKYSFGKPKHRELSESGLKCLRKHLKPDFKILQKLLSIGVISEREYALLLEDKHLVTAII